MAGSETPALQGTRIRTVRGHHPLLLTDPDVMWIVRSGSGAVFSSVTEGDLPIGPREFLLTVSEGEALFPVNPEAPGNPTRLMVLAVEDLKLLEVPLDRLEPVCQELGIGAVQVVEAWVTRLSAAVAGAAVPEEAEAISTGGERTLVEGQSLRAERGTVVWVRIDDGAATLMGVPELPLGSGPAHLALGPDLWIRASEPLRLLAETADKLHADGRLAPGLGLLHALVLQRLDLLATVAREAEIERLKEREARQSRVAAMALDEMASVLNPRETLAERETPLVSALALVGEVLGVEIRAPAKAAEPDAAGPSLEAIVRASHLRHRRVLLDGEWWKRDCGPLLATFEEGDRPVALLRTSRAGYEIVDPAAQTRIPLDVRSNAALAPEATMLYPRLPDDLRKPWQLVRYSLRGRARDVAFILGLSTVISLLGMLTPQAMAVVMDTAIPDANRRLLLELGLALVALVFGTSLLGLAQGLVGMRFGIGTDAAIQSAIWDRLLGLRVSFFRRYSSGDLLDRVMAVSAVTQELNGATLTSLLTGLMALLNLGLLFYYSATLAGMVMLLGFVIAVVTIAAGVFLRRYTRVLRELRGAFLGLVLQLVGSVGKIRVAGAQRHAFALWTRRYTEQLNLTLKAQGIEDYVVVFNQAVPTIGAVLLFWFGVQLISGDGSGGPRGELSVGIFLAFNVAMGTFLGGATAMSNIVVDVLETLLEGERVRPILEAEREYDEGKVDPGRLQGSLSLSHVDFRYAEDGPKILDDLSLEVGPGEFVAIVGPSGGGKSTIFRLLLGFEQPEAGAIGYDGQDFEGLDTTAVRAQIGVVLQSGRVDAGPILQTIGGGSTITLAEAWTAAEDAGLADEIREMPMGMHTMVSEGGTNFSGGQLQRLLIARALVTNPKILLMDEATSALDNRTQAIVRKSLDRRKVTRVVIAHRLSTIRAATRIYVLDQGRVVEQGSYDDLVAGTGLFAAMMARQLA